MSGILEIALSNAVLVTAAVPIVWLVAKTVRQPAFTHVLWVIVLLKLITPPLLRIPLHPTASQWNVPARIERSKATPSSEPIVVLPAAAEEVAPVSASPAIVRTVQPKPAESDFRVGPLLLRLTESLWILGSLICFTIALLRTIRLLRTLSRATCAPPGEQVRVRRLARRLNLRTAPVLCLARDVPVPMLWAVGRSARIIAPAALWDGLDRAQRDAIVVHELAHWRRRDHHVRWIELAAVTLFWWNPVCLWARRELREAEEQCCDAWVLWATGGFRDYADALLKAADFLSIQKERFLPRFAPARFAPVPASGMGQFKHLKRRIIMLKHGNVLRVLSWSGLAAACAMGALLLPLTPTLADDAPAPRPQQDQPAPAAQDNIATVPDRLPVAGRALPTPEAANSDDPKVLERRLQDASRQIAELTARLQEAEARLELLRAARPNSGSNSAVGEIAGAPRTADMARIGSTNTAIGAGPASTSVGAGPAGMSVGTGSAGMSVGTGSSVVAAAAPPSTSSSQPGSGTAVSSNFTTAPEVRTGEYGVAVTDPTTGRIKEIQNHRPNDGEQIRGASVTGSSTPPRTSADATRIGIANNAAEGWSRQSSADADASRAGAERLDQVEKQLQELIRQVDNLRRLQRQQSMNHMKQIILGCYSFAEGHNGRWPGSYDELAGSLPNAAELLTNPDNPGQRPGYVYLSPPSHVPDPARQIVLYEAFDKWNGGGICVGYADGSVRFLPNEAEFQKDLNGGNHPREN